MAPQQNTSKTSGKIVCVLHTDIYHAKSSICDDYLMTYSSPSGISVLLKFGFFRSGEMAFYHTLHVLVLGAKTNMANWHTDFRMLFPRKEQKSLTVALDSPESASQVYFPWKFGLCMTVSTR